MLRDEKKLLKPQSICLLDTAKEIRAAVEAEDYDAVNRLAHGASVVAGGLLKMSRAILEDEGTYTPPVQYL